MVMFCPAGQTSTVVLRGFFSSDDSSLALSDGNILDNKLCGPIFKHTSGLIPVDNFQEDVYMICNTTMCQCVFLTTATRPRHTCDCNMIQWFYGF